MLRNLLLFVVGWWCVGPSGFGAEEKSPDFVQAEIATLGVDRMAGSPVVVLQEKATGRLLPIWIGPAEARAIALVLEGVATPRPMTHDLLKSIIEASDLRVEGIRVEKLDGQTYFGSIFGTRAGREPEERGTSFAIDSRPSDALALALRLEVPIFVSESLLLEIPEFVYSPGDAPGRLRAFGLVWSESPDGEGLVISGIGEGAAEEIQEGDVVLQVNGQPVPDMAALMEVLQGAPKDQPLKIRLRRGDREWELELPRPVPAPVPASEAQGLQV